VTTAFLKLSGSGNDFIALPEPATPPTAGQIRAWCRRGIALGADGLFVLRREPATSGRPPAVVMDYWNSDGLPADLCLNGTRCAAQVAFHLGWAEREVAVATAAGRFAARRIDDARIALDLPAPSPAPRLVDLPVESAVHRGYFLTVGVPHLVLIWPGDLAAAPVVPLGRALRHHPVLGAPGANVSFVQFPTRERLLLRTYERGVEDETLSCGTGVLAASAGGLATGAATLPLTAHTWSGFDLAVGPGTEAGRWSFSGDARVVASGELLAGAEVEPER
jgi:diaminopimelate epimerase